MVVLFLLLITAIFVISGIMLSLGKWSFLISGYVMMPKEVKAKYNEKSLCRFMGKIMFIIAFCVFLIFLSEFMNIEPLRFIGLVTIFIISGFAGVYLAVSKKFKN